MFSMILVYFIIVVPIINVIFIIVVPITSVIFVIVVPIIKVIGRGDIVDFGRHPSAESTAVGSLLNSTACLYS
jgi:hypothetical protein